MKPRCSDLITILWLAGALLLTAQTPAPTPADDPRALNLAKRAFQDRLYDAAAQRFQAYLTAYPNSPSAPEARWLLGQSLFFQGRYAEALDLFRQKPPQPDSPFLPVLAFWEAESLSGLGDLPAARATYEQFLAAHPGHELVPAAKLGLAAVLFLENRRDDARRLLQDLPTDPKTPAGQRTILLRARMLLAENKNNEAQALLSSLLPLKPNPPLLFEIHYWLGELALKRSDHDAALEQFKKITADPRATPQDLVGKAWFGTGTALAARKNWEPAANAFEKAYTLVRDTPVQEAAFRRFLLAHRENKTASTGILKLREFVGRQGPAAAAGLYAIAELHVQTGNPDAAVSELDSLIRTYPDSPWTVEGRFLLGDILEKKGEIPVAIETYRALIEAGKNPERIRDARLRLAEISFKNKLFTEAAALYSEMARSGQDDPALETVLYNALLAFSGARRLDEFESTEKALQSRFPNSPLLKNAALERARLLELLGQGAKSREILTAFIQAQPADPLTPRALFALANSLFRDASYEAAAREYEKLFREFPGDPLAPTARFQHILADLRSGKVPLDDIRRRLVALSEQESARELAPAIAFKIAETFYEQQNYGDARAAFDQFVAAHPQHPDAEEALYWSGRCLMWLNQLAPAIETFEKIRDDSPRKTDARLAEIDCYRQLGNFEAALKIANSLTAKPENTAAGAEALLRKAGLLFTMASKDPALYPQSLAAADTVLAHPAANVAQRNEAGFIRGKSLEKLGRSQDALQAYLDVVYGKLLPPVEGPSQPEYRWFTRAGVEAALMKENAKDIRGAIAIYRILERLSGPQRAEFARKIEDLRTRNFIWEER